MIDYADKDRDGVINFDEFANVITKEYPKIWSLSIECILMYIHFLNQ